MQTFITDWPEMGYGLENLDQKRVVKQLLETRQIMAALAGITKGWVNHPAVKMWYGKEDMLYDYAKCNAIELRSRNYKWQNNLDFTIAYYQSIREDRPTDDKWVYPELEYVIYTHRGRLLEKDPDYYEDWQIYSDFRKYVCCPRCHYYWPSHIKQRAI